MKDIKGYEGLYAITSCGKVWSYRSKKFLKLLHRGNGYLSVNLYKDGKMVSYSIHRLVAEAYIPNPENKPQVGHLDENPSHNWINNLEWCFAKENCNYGTHNKKLGKAVYCVELNKIFDTASEAARELNICNHISECCAGKRKTAGGYHWEYAE